MKKIRLRDENLLGEPNKLSYGDWSMLNRSKNLKYVKL